MAGAKRTWVRQVFMKQSFMRRRTTAIYDCWLDPLAGARSVFREGPPSVPCPSTGQARDRGHTKARKSGRNHLSVNSLQGGQRIGRLGNRAADDEVVGAGFEGIGWGHDALLVAFVGGQRADSRGD
ncbi:hypothetical protein FIU96_11040 [Marinobacter sp. THAF39]|nr:hypothetical protein FIV08_11125 [Marinobacter sp. THAF197a]QFT51164.1 hypothetical protein FIU96_11040 [Marinobacter sp. THAF39]